jgi:hypothetical protein
MTRQGQELISALRGIAASAAVLPLRVADSQLSISS